MVLGNIYIYISYFELFLHTRCRCLYVCLRKLVHTVCCVIADLGPGSFSVCMEMILVYSLWSFIAPAHGGP